MERWRELLLWKSSPLSREEEGNVNRGSFYLFGNIIRILILVA
jgi:hypothetical protein